MFADNLFVPKKETQIKLLCELKHLSNKRKKKLTKDFASSGERTQIRLSFILKNK